MADSVVEIVNTTITSTELPTAGASYTLLTTDANTSYVIKDVQVSTLMTDLQASINGFPVGNWSQSLTGSEVMDVSSTLSVSSDQFPAQPINLFFPRSKYGSKQYTKGFITLINDQPVYQELESEYAPYTGNATGSSRSSAIFSGQFFYNMAWDNNSSVYIQKYDNGVYTNLSPSSYGPFWHFPEGDGIFYRVSDDLRKVTISTGVVSTVRAGAFTGMTFSSYPRMDSCNGWLFSTESSSNPSYLFAWNALTGLKVTFSNTPGFGTTYDQYAKIAVSYDPDADRFVFFTVSGTGTSQYLTKSYFPVTVSTMNSYATDTNVASGFSFHSTVTLITAGLTQSANANDYMCGHPTNPDAFFFYSGVTAGPRIGLYEFAGTFPKWVKDLPKEQYNSGNLTHPFLKAYIPSSAEIDETDYPAPVDEIKIRITGVKTVS